MSLRRVDVFLAVLCTLGVVGCAPLTTTPSPAPVAQPTPVIRVDPRAELLLQTRAGRAGIGALVGFHPPSTAVVESERARIELPNTEEQALRQQLHRNAPSNAAPVLPGMNETVAGGMR